MVFAGIRESFLNTRQIGGVFKHLPRDAASVNAMKQTCMLVILAHFTSLQLKFALKTLLEHKKYPFPYAGIL